MALKRIESSTIPHVEKAGKVKETTSRLVLAFYGDKISLPGGFIHCMLTQMKLPLQRLEKLGFYEEGK
jgi:hypothetical protein